MGAIHKVGVDGKSKLTKEQQAKLPKENLGGKADEFEKTCADAIKKLRDAANALQAVWVDGEDEGSPSVRHLLESYNKAVSKDKAMLKAIAQVTIDVDRLKAGFLKKVMHEYGIVKAVAAKLNKYAD